MEQSEYADGCYKPREKVFVGRVILPHKNVESTIILLVPVFSFLSMWPGSLAAEKKTILTLNWPGKIEYKQQDLATLSVI